MAFLVHIKTFGLKELFILVVFLGPVSTFIVLIELLKVEDNMAERLNERLEPVEFFPGYLGFVCCRLDFQVSLVLFEFISCFSKWAF